MKRPLVVHMDVPSEQGQQIQAVFETMQHLIEAPPDEGIKRFGFPTSEAQRVVDKQR